MARYATLQGTVLKFKTVEDLRKVQAALPATVAIRAVEAVKLLRVTAGTYLRRENNVTFKQTYL